MSRIKSGLAGRSSQSANGKLTTAQHVTWRQTGMPLAKDQRLQGVHADVIGIARLRKSVSLAQVVLADGEGIPRARGEQQGDLQTLDGRSGRIGLGGGLGDGRGSGLGDEWTDGGGWRREIQVGHLWTGLGASDAVGGARGGHGCSGLIATG
jgi:hypothetical protein